MQSVRPTLPFLLCIFVLQNFLAAKQGFAWTEPDWSENATVPWGESRENIYALNPLDLKKAKQEGYKLASRYPVDISGLFVPYSTFKIFFPPLLADQFYDWLGLSPYNSLAASNSIYETPQADPQHAFSHLGVGVNSSGKGLTFGCYACHSGVFFGKTVLGLANKRPRANELFYLVDSMTPWFHVPQQRSFSKLPDFAEDQKMLFTSLKNLQSVGVKKPQVLGLDTSLSQVALSLAKRNSDPQATKSSFYEDHPRPTPLDKMTVDSKPMPWWNLKYKTKWLSDGSIVSGNPILTNFLWNELGRGTDLVQLKKWMSENRTSIQALTATVFATPAPRWTDFFSIDEIDLPQAQKGEVLFNQNCARCHGFYEKRWSTKSNNPLSKEKWIETTKVFYRTSNVNVGTDPQRAAGMKYFSAQLNQLEISKWMKTVVTPQKGYTPPPLVAIWMRYPYLHNNSVPNLCALLTVSAKRPLWFIQGKAEVPSQDFDSNCVGYPTGKKIPPRWLQDKSAYFDTQKPGLRNIGHESMLTDEKGAEIYTSIEKQSIIEFLKTL